MKRILIVDDDNAIISNMSEVLNLEGYETASLLDSLQAVDHARHFQPDLIFSDVVMPGMDGLSLLAALREDPDTMNIPLVFVTGQMEPLPPAPHQPDGFLMKPFTIEELLQTIQQYAR